MKKIKLIHCLLLLLLGSAAEAKPNCVSVGSGLGGASQNYSYFTTWCCENNGSFYGVTVYHASWNYNNIWTGIEYGCGALDWKTRGPLDIDLDREKAMAEDLLMTKIDL